MTAETVRASDGFRQSVSQNARLDRAYLIMNALAAVVASYGLLQDSVAVVIGAMVIATLLGPITGIALALVDGDNALLRGSLLAEAVGVIVVLAVAFLIGRANQDIPLGRQILSRTSPNVMDLMIALGGGAAGAYAAISPRVSAGLVGVAIATALVPPLSVCAICVARGDLLLGLGALLLFLANLIAIQLASSVVMVLHGYHRIADRPATLMLLLRRHVPSAVLLLALAIGLTYNLSRSVARQRFEKQVRATLEQELGKYHGAFLADLRTSSEGDRTTLIAVVRTPFSITPQQVSALQSKLLPLPGKGLDLHVRSVLTKEASSRGYLWELPPPRPPEAAGTPVPLSRPSPTLEVPSSAGSDSGSADAP